MTQADLFGFEKKEIEPADETEVLRIYTAGYGNRTMAEFRNVLKAEKIDVLIDLRVEGTGAWSADYVMPTIKKKLRDFEYIQFPKLGNTGGILGRRTHGESPQLRNSRMREYKRWINTEDGLEAVADLCEKFEDRKGKRVCLMCCEKEPFRMGKYNCHRAIVAESVAKMMLDKHGKGYDITHIINPPR